LLQAGDIAPDFKIPVLIGGVRKEFRLTEHRGKGNLVLAFYPANWDPVSTQQMVNYQVERETFQVRQTEVLGISVDSIMNTTSWEREIGPFDFWLGNDFWPHGDVSRLYGVFRESEPLNGASDRAIFVIDKSGKIRFTRTYALDQLPTLEETFAALRELAKT
jgi:alkyl hydroperoxide reductase subunit AhpC